MATYQRVTLLLYILIMCRGEAFAQKLLDTANTLQQRAYGSIVHLSYPQNIEWMPDGEHYIQVEQNDKAQKEIVTYSVKDESRTILIPANQLMVDKTSKNQIEPWEYSFSKDIEKVLFFINTKKVWRYYTRGD